MNKNYLIFLFLFTNVVIFGQPIQMGSSKNYIPYEYKWQDIRVSILATNAGGSNPPGLTKLIASGSSQGVFCFAFDRNIEEEVYTTIQIPHSIRKTYLSPHIHWAPSDTTLGTVTWGIEWIYYNYNSSGSASSEIYRTSQYTSGTARKHHIATFNNIDITNVKDSSIFIIRIFRDATNIDDTYSSDAFAFDFDCHFQTKEIGSNELYGDN